MRTLRTAERILVVYFAYVAVASLFFPLRPGIRWIPFVIAIAAFGCFRVLGYAEARWRHEGFGIAREWFALAFTLSAYREMDLFTRPFPEHLLERAWIVWDHRLLNDWGARAGIELLGPLLPAILELAYVLVYAVAPFSLVVFYAVKKPERINTFLVIWLLGTLTSYALFPYFPSDPPRRVFPALDLPQIITPVRRFNLWILGGYGIHSSVFPSAHVSSAFSAAFGLMRILPERPWFGRAMLIYAVLVATATVYGRYHYLVDALAGLGVSILTYAVWRMTNRPSIHAAEQHDRQGRQNVLQ